MTFEIPALDKKAVDAWNSFLKKSLGARGLNFKSLTDLAREVDKAEVSKFAKADRTVAERWFNRSDRAALLAEKLGLSVGALHAKLVAIARGLGDGTWHEAFPGVAAEDARIEPRVLFDRDSSEGNSIDALLVWLETAKRITVVQVEGAPGSGRRTIAAILRERVSAAKLGRDVRIEFVGACSGPPRWLSTSPNTDVTVRTVAWGKAEAELVVERLASLGAIEAEQADLLHRFVVERVAESDEWLGLRRLPGDVIHLLAEVARTGPPGSLAESLERAARQAWDRWRTEDELGVLNELPDRFPVEFWSSLFMRPGRTPTGTVGESEVLTVLEELSLGVAAGELAARVWDISRSDDAGERGRLSEGLLASVRSGAPAVAKALRSVSFLVPSDGGALAAAVYGNVPTWVALGTLDQIQTGRFPLHRLGDPALFDVAVRWGQLGLSLPELLAALGEVTGTRAIAAGWVIVCHALGSEETPLALSPAHRSTLARLWATAVWSGIQLPPGALSVSRDVKQALRSVSRKLAVVLPTLPVADFAASIEALVGVEVVSTCATWARLARPALEGGWANDPLQPQSRGGSEDLDRTIRWLCPVQTIPRTYPTPHPGDVYPPWTPEDYAALERVAESGDAATIELFAGVGVEEASRAAGWAPAKMGDPFHPWFYLPADARLRRLGRGASLAFDDAWTLFRYLVSRQGDRDILAEVAEAWKRMGLEQVESRLIAEFEKSLADREIRPWTLRLAVPIETVLALAEILGLAELLTCIADAPRKWAAARLDPGVSDDASPSADPNWPAASVPGSTTLPYTSKTKALLDCLSRLERLALQAAVALHPKNPEPLRRRASYTWRIQAAVDVLDLAAVGSEVSPWSDILGTDPGVGPMGILWGPDMLDQELGDQAVNALVTVGDAEGLADYLVVRFDTDGWPRCWSWSIYKGAEGLVETIARLIAARRPTLFQGILEQEGLRGATWAFGAADDEQLRRWAPWAPGQVPIPRLKALLDQALSSDNLPWATLAASALAQREARDTKPQEKLAWRCLAHGDPFAGPGLLYSDDGTVAGGAYARLAFVGRLALDHRNDAAILAALDRWWKRDDLAWPALWSLGERQGRYVELGQRPPGDYHDARSWLAQTARDMGALSLLESWSSSCLRDGRWSTPLATWWLDQASASELIERLAEPEPSLRAEVVIWHLHARHPLVLRDLFLERPGLVEDGLAWLVDIDPGLVVERLNRTIKEGSHADRQTALGNASRLAPHLRRAGVELGPRILDWMAQVPAAEEDEGRC